ncbi:MAG: hypothetical protein RIQ93_1156 [Verrucomicrobiota bacterium]|jgi:hypothetical protein
MLAVAFGASGMAATNWPLPSLSGDLTGDLLALKIPGAPPLHWKIELGKGPAKIPGGLVELSGQGTWLRAAVESSDLAGGNWRVAEARVDLAVWSAALVARLGEEYAGAAISGVLQVEGHGGWAKEGVTGRGQFKVREGRLDFPTQKFGLEGVALDFAFDDIAGRRSPATQTLTWTAGHFDVLPIGPGRVVFSLAGEQVMVEEATVALWGGEVVLAAFAFNTSKLEMSVIARVTAIDVKHLLPLLPPVLKEAQGRLDGSVTLSRDAAGIAIGGGRLALRSGEAAQLRFAPTPGLLSKSLPATVLKYYPGLKKIESGETPLRAELLEVSFTPDGDAEGRTASIRLAGGPVDPKLRAPIDLSINVRGPLESLVKFGTNSRLHFGAKP